MGDPITTITAVSSLLGAAQSARGLFGGGGRKREQRALPEPAPSPRAKLPKPPPELEQFGGQRPGEIPEAPDFLNFGTGLTQPQQLSQIATGAVHGSDPRYRDPESQRYFRDLSLYSLTDPSGRAQEGGVLPIFRSYASNVLGQTPRTPDTKGFLNALLRG